MVALAHAGVSTRVVRPILAGLIMHGVDPTQALAEVKLDAATVADPDARIPHGAAVALWKIAEKRANGRAFGLRVAEAMDLAQFDVQIYAFMSSPNLGAGIEQIIRYHRLNHDAAKLSLIKNDATAIVRHTLPGAHRLPASAAQFIIGAMVLSARGATGVDVPIEEIRFQHSAPTDMSDYTRVLRAPVRFEAQHNELVLRAAALSLPHRKADPGLAAVLDRHGRALLDALPKVHSFADRVRTLLASELKGGNPSADNMAEKLRMSKRTLARRLAAEGTSHKALLDDLRASLARRYLADASLAISEVAFLLGFSEPSAFHRAFKRWTGQTPTAFRAAKS